MKGQQLCMGGWWSRGHQQGRCGAGCSTRVLSTIHGLPEQISLSLCLSALSRCSYFSSRDPDGSEDRRLTYRVKYMVQPEGARPPARVRVPEIVYVWQFWYSEVAGGGGSALWDGSVRFVCVRGIWVRL